MDTRTKHAPRMDVRHALLAGLALVALATSSAPAQVLSGFGVTLQRCVVNQNGDLTNGIHVVFFSNHHSPANEVDFLVHYHGHNALFVDRGTFAEGAQVSSHLESALVGRPWQGWHPDLCQVHRVTLADGKILQ